MNHWWVNHKQTFKSEFDGGYIWSPEKNANGSKNRSYDNLRETKVGDTIFSFSDGKIKAVGVIEEEYRLAVKPAEFGSTNNNWSHDGYLVRVNWTLLEVPLKPKSVIHDIRELLPPKYSPIQDNGNGNQGIYLAAISQILSERLLEFNIVANPALLNLINELRIEVEENRQIESILQEAIPDTEKEQLVKARIGQGLFKNRVFQIEKACRVTGIADARFLIASHIKPWRDASNDERLDGNNGLLLSPHVDKLFDKGWLTFSDTGQIVVANVVAQRVIEVWQIPLGNIGSFNKKQKEYLKYHRENVFNKFESVDQN